MRNLLGMSLAVLSLFLSAYSENIRKGYPSCATCHVAPSGGGILTEYGRTAGREFMPMFKTEPSEFIGDLTRLKFEFEQPDWLLTGGDLRYLVTPSAHFPMQADFEIGATYAGFTSGIMAGLYGRDRRLQTRRGYVKYQWKGLSFRYGRFMPNYGIYLADHTRPVRRLNGFDQGGETLNAELHYSSRYGEITATRIIARPSYRHPYYVDQYKDRGWVGKVSGFIGPNIQAGINFKHDIQNVGGLHLITGYKFLYYKGQLDRHPKQLVGYNELGVIPLKGVHLLAYSDYVGREYEPAVGFKLYPFPHMELTGRFEQDTMSSTIHYYW